MLQVCEHFVASIDVCQLGITNDGRLYTPHDGGIREGIANAEFRWLLLADGCGAKKLRGKIIADLLPKMYRDFPRLKVDEAWRQLSTDTHLLLLDAAFKGFQKALSSNKLPSISGYFPSELSLSAWQGFGSLP